MNTEVGENCQVMLAKIFLAWNVWKDFINLQRSQSKVLSQAFLVGVAEKSGKGSKLDLIY